MHEDAYYKLASEHPVELARKLRLDASALALLEPDQTVAEYVVTLAQTGQFRAALAMLAHALPKREAVWWGCVAVRHAEAPPPESAADVALKTAESWVYQPSEETRQPTGAAAARVGLGTAAGWAVIAAFWSGGSLAPADSPAVPPAPDLTGKAIAGATTLATMDQDPQLVAGKSVAFIRMALDIARGGDGRHVLG